MSLNPETLPGLMRRWQAARDRGHRCYAVVTGEAAGCRAWATALAAGAPADAVLWIGQRGPDGVRCFTGPAARQVLGGEHSVVVFDAHSGFDPDAFGAASGTLRGGGMLLLLAPPLALWPDYRDPDYERLAQSPRDGEPLRGRFLKRLVELIRRDEQICVVEQDSVTPPSHGQVSAMISQQVRPIRPTEDQQRAVAAIAKVVTGHRRRPLVLTADRGRGKSAAMGMAAAQLLANWDAAGQSREIVVTAPRAAAAAMVFDHCRRLLPGAGGSRYSVTTLCGVMRFVAPDELLDDASPAHLVLVDEAAAIPAPMLERVLACYARVVFATTVHGYEGTGRGFAVRFQQTLQARTPQWRQLRLQTPIRWALDDPLERFVFEALLLNACPAPDASLTGFELPAGVVARLDRDELVVAPARLSALFGLLVLAHYRSRPFDLRLMLDAPNVEVYGVSFNGHVVATVLAVAEGGFGEDDAAAIRQGRWRPRGHLLPETLAVHSGVSLAPRLRYLRIMRIAVHPALQRRGIGRRLVAAVVTDASRAGFDAVGVSFGATRDVLGFWSACGFMLLRLGLTRDHSSGTHSAVMVRPLSDAAERVAVTARQRLAANLPHQLLASLRDVDPHLAVEWLRQSDVAAGITMTTLDEQALQEFVRGWCGDELIAASLWRFVQWAVAEQSLWARLDDGQWRLLVLRVLQKKRWAEVVVALGLKGRGDAVAEMRRAIGCLLEARDEYSLGATNR